MPIIRKVFGPFHPEQTAPRSPSTTDLRWYFNGIRGDKTTAHWVLVFDPRKRKWSASNIPIGELDGKRNRSGLAQLGIPREVKNEDVHPDAWLDDSPVMEGTISSILKSKLSPEDIAKAMALALRIKAS
nr:hypothetical protein RNT25_01787 [arsenite-oxidising bacterium NT-25]